MARSSLWHRLQAKANREKARRSAKVLKQNYAWRKILNLGGLSERRRKLEESLAIARTCLEVNEDWDILCFACRKKIAIRRKLLKFRQLQQERLKSIRRKQKLLARKLAAGDKFHKEFEKNKDEEKKEQVLSKQKRLKRKRNDLLVKEEMVVETTQRIIGGANKTTIEAEATFGQGATLDQMLTELEERVRKMCKFE